MFQASMRISYYSPPTTATTTISIWGPGGFESPHLGGKFASTWELHRAMENLLEVGRQGCQGCQGSLRCVMAVADPSHGGC